MLALIDSITDQTPTNLGVAVGGIFTTAVVVVWFFMLRNRDAKALEQEFKERDHAAQKRHEEMRDWAEEEFVRAKLYESEKQHMSQSIDEIKAMVTAIHERLIHPGK